MSERPLIEDQIALPTTCARDLCSLFIGARIGVGSTRDVYTFLHDTRYVVKAELAGTLFQNAAEWKTWGDVKGTKLEKYFAPCLDISANGIYLLQRKVIPLDRQKLPKTIPIFFQDLKPENFGYLDGKLVCCDYGTAIYLDHLKEKKVKAQWRLE